MQALHAAQQIRANAREQHRLARQCQYRTAGTLEACAKLLYATEPPREPDTEFAYGGSQWQLAGALP